MALRALRFVDTHNGHHHTENVKETRKLQRIEGIVEQCEVKAGYSSEDNNPRTFFQLTNDPREYSIEDVAIFLRYGERVRLHISPPYASSSWIEVHGLELYDAQGVARSRVTTPGYVWDEREPHYFKKS